MKPYELQEIVFSMGDERYVGPLGEGYIDLIAVYLGLRKRIISCTEAYFPILPKPSLSEQEYLENCFEYSRSTHDPKTAKFVTRVIWQLRRDLRICKSWKHYLKWLYEDKPCSLYYVEPEAWYVGRRADIALVKDGRDYENPQVIVPVEIGDLAPEKIVEGLRERLVQEVWVVPYYKGSRYYVFGRGTNWLNPSNLSEAEYLDVVDGLNLSDYTKGLVKALIRNRFSEISS